MTSGESVAGDGGGSSSLTGNTAAGEPRSATADRRLSVLLAAAMFVLVVDTSLMNVSISKVVEDLGTTVSGVQGAIALEALVSAAFILIGSKVGDLIGRKRAFVMGLLGYALGALAMAFAQGLTAITTTSSRNPTRQDRKVVRKPPSSGPTAAAIAAAAPTSA